MAFARLLVLLLTAAVAAAVTGPDDFDGPTDVTLYLYTQANPQNPEYLVIGNDTASASFNPDNPTRLIFHGRMMSANDMTGFRDAYLATDKDYNVVLVDYAEVGRLNPETVAVQTTILVADYVGEVIAYFRANRSLDVNKLYILGFSMGGPVAGMVGNRVGNGSAAEVVGLDPAFAAYDNNSAENQLDASDAQFVQVIHTDGSGTTQRGHADFFPNGGTLQAGCDPASGGPSAGQNLCSHMRVLDLYIESISSQNLVAAKCDSYENYEDGLCSQNEHVAMGESLPATVSGMFYLDTNSASPFGQGQTDL